ATHHVLATAPEGDAAAVFQALDDFSAQHELGFGSVEAHGAALQAAIRTAAAPLGLSMPAPRPAALLAPLPVEVPQESNGRGLRVLVLESRVGAVELRCLPILIGMTGMGGIAHEVVSVEREPEMSSAGARLIRHALGSDADAEMPRVRHMPLLPAEDTTLAETALSLREDYELPAFDLLVLEGGDRSRQIEQIKDLLDGKALEPGAVVHASGPGHQDPGTARYMELLSGGLRGRFDSEVHDTGDGTAAVVSILRQWRKNDDTEL
ncbi:unnamed protein product, partial [Polarella glacialis]